MDFVHRFVVLTDRQAYAVALWCAHVVVAFDGSYRRDATALVICTMDGFLTAVVWERPEGAPADWKVPRGEVSDAISEAMERFEVAELAVDPFGWHSELETWREAYGSVVVEFPTNQRARMGPACSRFHSAVLEGELSHDGDPVLARHIGHCVAKATASGMIVTKSHPDSPRKIDAAVAAIVAFERAAYHASVRGGEWAFV